MELYKRYYILVNNAAQTSTSPATLTQGGWDAIREVLLSAADLDGLEPLWDYLDDVLLAKDASTEADDYQSVVVSATSCELMIAYGRDGAIELKECELYIHKQDVEQLLKAEDRQWVWEEILEFVDSAESALGTAAISRELYEVVEQEEMEDDRRELLDYQRSRL